MTSATNAEWLRAVYTRNHRLARGARPNDKRSAGQPGSPPPLSPLALRVESWPGLLSVAQLLIPVRAPLAREVEQVPKRLEGADAAVILPRVGRRKGELRAPEVADGSAVAVEHVEHRKLGSVGRFPEVVAVVGVGGR